MCPSSHPETNIIDDKIFKLYRSDETNDKSGTSLVKSSAMIIDQDLLETFCLRDFLSKKQEFFNDKIFEMTNKSENPDAPFRFVHLKIKNI